MKRYDDALEMCRIAVEIGYPHLDKLQSDKDLGPLLRRPDFKALFDEAQRAASRDPQAAPRVAPRAR